MFKENWHLIQWRTVKAVANNDLSRVMGLVPLAGYLILFNDEIASLASFDTLAGVADRSASPFFLSGVAKLRLVFFGSLLVFVSCVVYRVWRPPVLDWSNSEIEFAARVLDNYTVHEIVSLEAEVFSPSWKPRIVQFWKYMGHARKEPVLSGFRSDARDWMLSKHRDYVKFLAREWWAGMMHTYFPARVISMTMGILGYLLLALPTLDIAQAVIRDMLTV